MRKDPKKHFLYIGKKGELLTQLLLLDRGIATQQMSARFDFDLLTPTMQRIEVKTALPSYSKKTVRDKTYVFKKWQFRNYAKGSEKFSSENKGRNRQCDFFIFICLDENGNYYAAHIVPQEVIKDKLMINISSTAKSKLNAYKEAWRLLK